MNSGMTDLRRNDRNGPALQDEDARRYGRDVGYPAGCKTTDLRLNRSDVAETVQGAIDRVKGLLDGLTDHEGRLSATLEMLAGPQPEDSKPEVERAHGTGGQIAALHALLDRMGQTLQRCERTTGAIQRGLVS